VTAERLAEAMAVRTSWQAEIAAAFAEVDLLALPTLVGPPPLLSEFKGYPLTRLTGEDLLCATGLAVEAALSTRSIGGDGDPR
jgi:hypothetical protein